MRMYGLVFCRSVLSCVFEDDLGATYVEAWISQRSELAGSALSRTRVLVQEVRDVVHFAYNASSAIGPRSRQDSLRTMYDNPAAISASVFRNLRASEDVDCRHFCSLRRSSEYDESQRETVRE